MAGWTYIPLADLDRWQRTAVWIELYTAWNERRIAIGQSPVTVPTAGFKIQDKDAIQDIQAWIETYASSFVATIDNSLNPITDYDDADAIEMWDWTKLKTRVLSGNSSWSRKSGSTLSYGQLAQGYNASFITQINELRLVLNQLVWTKQNITEIYTNGIENACTYGYASGDAELVPVTWSTLMDSVETSWPNYNNWPELLRVFRRQRGTWRGIYHLYFHPLDAFVAECYASSDSWKVKLSNIPFLSKKKEVVFYFYATSYYGQPHYGRVDIRQDSYTFDRLGNSFLLENKWAKYPTSQIVVENESETLEYQVGDEDETFPYPWTDAPDYPTSIANTTSLNAAHRGWTITDEIAIIRWNVTDGFEYV